MLKKFFIASLIFVFTATANATPVKPSITGEFDIFANADITLNAAGEVSFIDFSAAMVAVVQPGDYTSYLTGFQAITLDANPLDISAIMGLQLWSVSGFEFTATEIRKNQTVGAFTSLAIIGDVSHDDFLTTSSEFFLSFQNLTVDGTKSSGFSGTVTSPIPEPSSLAIFGLSLIGFAAGRKKKSA